MDRRRFLAASMALPAAAAVPSPARGQARSFAPQPGPWRSFEITTRIEILGAADGTQAWVPVPGIDTEWQKSGASRWTGNIRSATIESDPVYGAKMVHATWSDGERVPAIEVVSRFQSRDRALDWSHKERAAPDEAERALALKATSLLPNDGIVRDTAQKIVAGRSGDIERVRAMYDWIVTNTHREPKVRGCGVGDIRAMLETGDLGGKCGDINALFVGLCRAVGIPARDIYGIRATKSAFGYRELGAGSADITKAQHCRAEVWLADYGWVAMDPADVGKVMRQETPEWLKDPRHDVVAPVYLALFGGWEGNWMAYNRAHDVALPGATGPKLGFLMYPQAETRGERVDSLDPETFQYRIMAREITA